MEAEKDVRLSDREPLDPAKEKRVRWNPSRGV